MLTHRDFCETHLLSVTIMSSIFPIQQTTCSHLLPLQWFYIHKLYEYLRHYIKGKFSLFMMMGMFYFSILGYVFYSFAYFLQNYTILGTPITIIRHAPVQDLESMLGSVLDLGYAP